MILESLSYTIFVVVDVAVLNSYEVLFLGYYFARALCARITGHQTVIQDGDLRPC